MTNAKMIVIEGIEGAGKSTALEKVKTYLLDKNIKFICTREPGGTVLGESLRDLLKSTDSEFIQPQTELLLMYASRTQLFHNVIKKALNEGIWVLSDRFELSSYAYQGIGRGLGLEPLKSLSALCLDNFKPDLTLYLDVSYEVSQARLLTRGIAKDRIEKEDNSFFNEIREGYLSFCQSDNSIQIIDAEKSVEQVEQSIVSVLDERLCL